MKQIRCTQCNQRTFPNSNSRNLIIQQDYKSVAEFSNSQSSRQSQENSEEKQLKIQEDYQNELYPTHEDQIKQEKSEENIQEQNKKTKKNKKKKKIKKMTLKQKRQKQLKRNQSQNSKRNIIPNQIHQMLSILFKKKKSTTIVERLMARFKTSQNSISIQRFYLYQSLLKEKINHYANQQSLKVLFSHLQPAYNIYSFEQQSIYCKMGLILINYFLDNQATLIILNSQRIKSENKLDHLRTKRYLSCILSQISKMKHSQ